MPKLLDSSDLRARLANCMHHSRQVFNFISMVQEIKPLKKRLPNSALHRSIDSSLSANFSLKPGLDLSARFMQLRGTPVSHLY